ncbi:MAG: zinc ribbon domain-containing protein [Gemmatimonadota bacterium]|nr:MAG: zinc ribbon domain-containing protein [Gemmatimonadota bacterium]
MNETTCPTCGESVPHGHQTCAKCGVALSYEPAQPDVGCAVCQAPIDAYVETCPRCGETGYPALRPRRGKGWKGAPDGD